MGFERVTDIDGIWLKGTSSRLVMQVSKMEQGATYMLDCGSKQLARDRRKKISVAISQLGMSSKVSSRTEGTKLYIIKL